MFLGEYEHSIDAKGRLIIPAKIRNECNGSVVITRGNDGCLAMYTNEGWTEYFEKLRRLPKGSKKARDLVRFTTANAGEFEFDKLGRINIPEKLRKQADLKKECVVVGAGDHAEIWSLDKWNTYYDESEPNYDEIFSELNEEGLDI
ncbi:MAG: division/cell wall cluster transcriptional repressor MraZ [Thomasclavelia sp.]|nr:division/cell wall cluster transcriptional repressor MraZ [Thomasclavelia sp.]